MKKVIAAAFVMLLLTGCGADRKEIFKAFVNDCVGDVEYTLAMSEWSTSLSATCVGTRESQLQ